MVKRLRLVCLTPKTFLLHDGVNGSILNHAFISKVFLQSPNTGNPWKWIFVLVNLVALKEDKSHTNGAVWKWSVSVVNQGLNWAPQTQHVEGVSRKRRTEKKKKEKQRKKEKIMKAKSSRSRAGMGRCVLQREGSNVHGRWNPCRKRRKTERSPGSGRGNLWN